MDYADPKKKNKLCGNIFMVSTLTTLCILMLKQLQILIPLVPSQIDKSVKRVHKRVPKSLKRVYRRAFKKAKKAPIAARSVMFDVKSAGMVETASGLAKTVYDKYEPVAKDIYSKYEPVTEQYAAHAWHFLNQYTLFNRAAKTVTPIASYYSEKYNQKVQDSAEKGSRVASRLPLVPTEKIARVLSNGNIETEKIDRVLSNGNVEPMVEAEVSQEEAVTT